MTTIEIKNSNIEVKIAKSDVKNYALGFLKAWLFRTDVIISTKANVTLNY